MNNNDICVKEKLKPWLVGLVVIILIIIGWIIFGNNRKSGIAEDKMVAGKIKLDPPPAAVAPAIRARTQQDSYRNVVESVMPAVVGIALPGARPFLQRWNQQITQPLWPSKDAEGQVPPTGPMFQPQAQGKTFWPSKDAEGEAPITSLPKTVVGGVDRVGLGANILNVSCPNCGAAVTRQPGIPWTSINCPNCGTNMSCLRTGGNVQPQAWGFGANVLNVSCPNCGAAVTRQPGIPWTSINCPNCGTNMSCLRTGGNVQPQAWPQITGQQTQPQLQKEEYLLCPNCQIKLNQTPGIPWSNAKCPGCGTVMAHMIRETQQPVSSPSPVQEQVWNPQQSALQPNQVQNQAVNQPGFQGLGSGLIVSKKGFILTSSHLISGVNTVTVTLFTPQGQQSFTGRVVARADDRDLAIIQIDPKNVNLPVVPLGNSDTVQLGSTVLAFGNPFGLSQTVTSGIVSAVRKSIIIEGHQLNDVIQTDAPMNAGNSGGPLVNSRGKVIGINTAIFSPGQTHTGLGFAIPINHAKEVFANYMDLLPVAQQQTMQYLNYPQPKVYPTAANEDMPVWLGLNIQIMNDVLAEQLNVPVDRGILINEVYQNSPAAASGLQRGDVIIRFDGKRINDETQIRLLLADKKPGDKIKLTLLRGRKQLNIVLDTAGGAWQQAAALNTVAPQKNNLLKGSEIETGSAELVSVGIAAVTITPEICFAYGLPENTQGIIATETEGLALKYGLKDGDIIQAVNGKPTPDLVGFMKAIKRGDLVNGVNFVVIRKGQPLEIVIKEQPQLLPKGL